MRDRILNYWYEQEFFNPCWPVEPKQDVDLTTRGEPWAQTNNNPLVRTAYDVYLGWGKTRDLIGWMLEALRLDAEESAIEADNSATCLCAMKLNENGQYIANSFAISSFAWAACTLVREGSISAKLDAAELEKLQHAWNDALLQRQKEACEPAFSKEKLLVLFGEVCGGLGVADGLLKSALWAREKKQHANKKGEFPPLDPSTELLQSFYLKDMEAIRKAPTKTVSVYIQAMVEPVPKAERVQIDTDTEQMRRWLRADAFPLGAWPSRYSPSLMQQLGINLAVSGEQRIFSVNGPPGTGKTTLLKEIIASNVVERAIRMAEYAAPDDAFRKQAFQAPPDQYNQSYYKLHQDLSAYGILVASNNNAAVENISMELPKAIQEDRTGRFSGAGRQTMEETYFADVATELLGEPAWGLISAKLGKKGHLKALKDRLWWAKEGTTLQCHYAEETVDWNAARERFAKALQAVRDEQGKIAQAQALLAQQEDAAEAGKEAVRAACKEQARLAESQNAQTEAERRLALQRENAALLKSAVPFLKRILRYRKDPMVKKWLETEQAVQETLIQVTRLKSARHEQEDAARSAQETLQQAEAKLADANAAVEPERARFGGNWADAAFWKNISANEPSQTACPWTCAGFDRAREELFYQALMLHKAFTLSSNCVKQNLRRLFAMWDGKFTDKADCRAAYADLLNTLLLIVPVISTTFASVQSFLDGVQAEELGLLVVDESGQATPQSALGALWRTRSAIVVGDPLQVEPIVTIPAELRKRFADENGIPEPYRLPDLSVQVLADRCNRYGGVRTLNGEVLWLGCPLVVHRRCLNPMFAISNEVAYNGRMFQKTAEPGGKRFLFPQSIWLDVKGTEQGNKNHSVPEQIDAAAQLVSKAAAVYEGLPKLYLITPFTTVNRALQDALYPALHKALPELELEEIRAWLKESCGTIHTFQGKEANEVLLVLGCDGQSGKGAAQWVGQKPNIINVAVSRAKYRLGVIGDYDLWKNIPYVGTVCKYLEKGR